MDLSDHRIRCIKKLLRNQQKVVTLRNFCRKWKKIIVEAYLFLVLDFDGTIRDKSDRNGPINQHIATEISRIAFSNNEGNIIIATGRKSSGLRVIEDFIKDKEFEINMILGNGSEIISIPSGKIVFIGQPFESSEVKNIYTCLTDKCRFNKRDIHNSENKMIRIFLDCDKEAAVKVKEVKEKIRCVLPKANVTHSGFNIEIVPSGISKEKAISYLIGKTDRKKVLAIGDSGWRCGNDYGMLSYFPSFCVGENCGEFLKWTLPVIDDTGAILSGPEATLYLLKHIFISNS